MKKSSGLWSSSAVEVEPPELSDGGRKRVRGQRSDAKERAVRFETPAATSTLENESGCDSTDRLEEKFTSNDRKFY